MRYIDSSTRALEATLFGWLKPAMETAVRLAIQTGYYRSAALEPFADDIERIFEEGGRVDLVVGANEERLAATDLEETLQLLDPGLPDQASFSLVGARNGLFHPKTYYVERSSGERIAFVGSPNLTPSGAGQNIEAGLTVTDAEDGAEVLDQVRDAILSWSDRAGTGALAQPITPQLIRNLEAERAIDPAADTTRQSRIPASDHFPALERIVGVPTAPRRRRPRARAGARVGTAPNPLPDGAVGIVKRLSRSDTKGFRSEPGTPYIALPARLLANRLPLEPAGKRGEPRLDVVVEARLGEARARTISSRSESASIIHVGAGETQSGNRDLRLNLPKRLHSELRVVSIEEGAPLPDKDDVVAIELPEDGKTIRLTFVTAGPLCSALLKGIDSGSSGWLQPTVLPRW